VRSFLGWGASYLLDRFEEGRGCFLAIIGPDGSGKTTLVNEVNRILEGRLFPATYHMSGHFKILPLLSTISAVLTGRCVVKQDNSGAFQGFQSGMLQDINPAYRSVVYATWYSIDLLLGRIVLFKVRLRGYMVFFARYFYDYYYQRCNAKAPRWYLDLVHFFIPKPDLVFFIDRDPNDIFEKKPELSIEEIVRQQKIINELAGRYSNFVRINGDFGITVSVMEILEAVNKLVKSRNSLLKHV
jgi:thymidylate kinase